LQWLLSLLPWCAKCVSTSIKLSSPASMKKSSIYSRAMTQASYYQTIQKKLENIMSW
jgi:hypothetical protein